MGADLTESRQFAIDCTLADRYGQAIRHCAALNKVSAVLVVIFTKLAGFHFSYDNGVYAISVTVRVDTIIPHFPIV